MTLRSILIMCIWYSHCLTKKLLNIQPNTITIIWVSNQHIHDINKQAFILFITESVLKDGSEWMTLGHFHIPRPLLPANLFSLTKTIWSIIDVLNRLLRVICTEFEHFNRNFKMNFKKKKQIFFSHKTSITTNNRLFYKFILSVW